MITKIRAVYNVVNLNKVFSYTFFENSLCLRVSICFRGDENQIIRPTEGKSILFGFRYKLFVNGYFEVQIYTYCYKRTQRRKNIE